jgi:hypothetical protein
MKANPRINYDTSSDYQLPPGELWWISRCRLIPDIVITFSGDIGSTWFVAHQQACIFWRLQIQELHSQHLFKGEIDLEKETQQALKAMKTELWTE